MQSRGGGWRPGGVYVVKLGGSVITDKQEPFSLNLKTLDSLAEQIYKLTMSSASIRGIVVGGGSYGHYVATVYRENESHAAEAFSVISNTMLELALTVSEVLRSHGVNTAVFPPHSFCKPVGLKPNCDWSIVASVLSLGIIPLVYGDVYSCGNSWCIVSGDELSIEMACSLGASYVIYVTDVDGVFDGEGRVIARATLGELRARLSKKEAGEEKSLDVTGGIERKIRAIEVNRCDKLKGVWIVNGLRRDILLQVASQENATGTFIDLSGE